MNATSLERKATRTGYLYRIGDAGPWMSEYAADCCLPRGIYSVTEGGVHICWWTHDPMSGTEASMGA